MNLKDKVKLVELKLIGWNPWSEPQGFQAENLNENILEHQTKAEEL